MEKDGSAYWQPLTYVVTLDTNLKPMGTDYNWKSPLNFFGKGTSLLLLLGGPNIRALMQLPQQQTNRACNQLNQVIQAVRM